MIDEETTKHQREVLRLRGGSDANRSSRQPPRVPPFMGTPTTPAAVPPIITQPDPLAIAPTVTQDSDATIMARRGLLPNDADQPR